MLACLDPGISYLSLGFLMLPENLLSLLSSSLRFCLCVLMLPWMMLPLMMLVLECLLYCIDDDFENLLLISLLSSSLRFCLCVLMLPWMMLPSMMVY